MLIAPTIAFVLTASAALSATAPCRRWDTLLEGDREVTVLVANEILRFVEVAPPDRVIHLGISEEQAAQWFRQVQGESTEAIVPRLSRSIGTLRREVPPFLLADRLVPSRLYSELTRGRPSDRVSPRDADAFLRALNERCRGVVAFRLPSEEQWLAAAREIYDPGQGVRSCASLRAAERKAHIRQLFGYRWQLTSSPCEPFTRDAADPCDPTERVRKGGTASSSHSLECLPEYRSTVPLDIASSETSIRLALIETKKH